FSTSNMPLNGLVSLWRGEGDAVDAAGGNSGSLVNGVTFGPGQVGQGFQFNGTNQYVLIPDSPSLNLTGDLTIEAWVKPNSTDTPIIDRRSGENNNIPYQLYVNSVNHLAFGSRIAGVSNDRATVATLPMGQFSHVAVTLSGSTLTFYINGIAETPINYPVV